MQVVVLGVGDAFSARYYSSALAVLADDGRWLLIDCPHPIHKVLAEASASCGVELPLDKLVGVVLTHTHSDHASGLEGLGAYLRWVCGRPTSVQLLSTKAVLDHLRTTRPKDAEYLELVQLEPGEKSDARYAPFVVETRAVSHGDMPACAFRVRAGGRGTAHSGDTKFDAALVDWLASADWWTYEVGLGMRDKLPAEPTHTAYSELVALPPEKRRGMRLIHYPDTFDPRLSTIPLARQGVAYRV